MPRPGWLTFSSRAGKLKRGVELDKEALAKRQADTEALVATDKFQRDMEEGREALERELAKAKPTGPAPYGLKADGTPRKAPGPAKRAPDAREARRADLRTEQERQEDMKAALEPAEFEHPEDHPDVTVRFDYQPGERAPVVTPEAPDASGEPSGALTVERHTTAAGYEVLTAPWTGQRRVGPADPSDPLALPTIETRTYRIAGDMRDYILERLVNGRWTEEARGSEVGSLALKLAMGGVVPAAEFHEAARTLPLNRPLTAARRLALQPKDLPQLTPEQKREHSARVKEAMIGQRIARAPRERENGGGVPLMFASGEGDCRP